MASRPGGKSTRGSLPIGKSKIPLLVKLKAAGFSDAHAGRILGVTRQSVGQATRHPEIAPLIAGFAEAGVENLLEQRNEVVSLAFGTVVELMISGEAEAVRLRAATEALDRLGVTKELAIKITGETTSRLQVDLSAATLEQLAAAAPDEIDELEAELDRTDGPGDPA